MATADFFEWLHRRSFLCCRNSLLNIEQHKAGMGPIADRIQKHFSKWICFVCMTYQYLCPKYISIIPYGKKLASSRLWGSYKSSVGSILVQFEVWFGFWRFGRFEGRFSFEVRFWWKTLKDHSFSIILFSKVQCSVQVLACSIGSRFGIQEQTANWCFGRFGVQFLDDLKVRCFKISPKTTKIYWKWKI